MAREKQQREEKSAKIAAKLAPPVEEVVAEAAPEVVAEAAPEVAAEGEVAPEAAAE